MRRQQISLPSGGNYSSRHTMPRYYTSVSSVGAGALQRHKCVRSESGRRCNRSLPKPPLLLVLRAKLYAVTAERKQARAREKEEDERETAAGKEKQLSSDTARPNIPLVFTEGGVKRLRFLQAISQCVIFQDLALMILLYTLKQFQCSVENIHSWISAECT